MTITGPGVVGNVEVIDLSRVKPNPWNPNSMTEFERKSLRTGFESDGWLASQALLIWGTDEHGKKQNLIIDGEHRYTVAKELGFEKGPMVFLSGLREAQAKALTVKMNAKRGKMGEDKLGALLREIQHDLEVPDLALDIGIAPEEMMKLLAFDAPDIVMPGEVQEPHEPNRAPPETVPPMQHGHVELVQLFFEKSHRAEFTELVKKVGARLGTQNVSDTCLAALRKAAEEPS